MAAAIVASIPPTLDRSHSSPSLSRNLSSNGSCASQEFMASTTVIPLSRAKKERPCDTCRKRKTRCVTTDDGTSCAACGIHSQECTYTEHPQPRKRRLDGHGPTVDQSKRRSISSSALSSPASASTMKPESRPLSGGGSDGVLRSPAAAFRTPPQHYGTHIGPTVELEPFILGLSPNGAIPLTEVYQDRGGAPFMLDRAAVENSMAASSGALDRLERIVGAHCQSLLQIYMESVNGNVPIVENEVLVCFKSGIKSGVDPVLLAAVFASTIPWLTDGRVATSGDPAVDLSALEDLAFSLFTDSLANPSLATIQAGILLMQRPNIDSKSLNAQIVGAAHDLGLQVDCTPWSLTPVERGLRKRLAWALYMQDKWCSLIYGRPAAIHRSNWAVKPLSDDDFEPPYDESEKEVAEAERRRLIFKQMVGLTEILSLVLDTFYTLQAMKEVEEAAQGGTRLILERAKPVQIKLKAWFGDIPTSLKMDANASGKPSNTGFMHLAYYATEITLHRSIIRSLHTSSCDGYLSYICRSAAKTRLISAMDFANRVHPEHLTSFWYFPSRVCFAFIGTFGSLLLATAPCQEEVDFYRLRLNEYRWTLAVSSRSAPFLCFAVENLDVAEDLLKNLPRKPRTADALMQRKPDEGAQTRSPPQEFDMDGEEILRPGMSSLAADADSIAEASGLASPSASTDSDSASEAADDLFPMRTERG